MKRTFSKNLGRVTENLELGLEENLIYVHYTKGNFEKSTCILKNDEKSLEEYLKSFLTENNVSDDMKRDVTYFLTTQKETADDHWKEFSNFLLRALSLHMVFGLTIALAVFAGYTFGLQLDNHYGIYPMFTLIGIFAGLGTGGLTAYTMVHKYFKHPSQPAPTLAIQEAPVKQGELPVIDVSIEEVRKAIRRFSDELPQGIYRTILVNDDNSIDFSQLSHILKGIPSRKFYMSKETYDLFEESEKDIPIEMDFVQKAVDQYSKDHKEYPMLKFDTSRRVNYYQLLSEHYLKSRPENQFYITDLDGMVSHKKPSKKQE